MSLLQLVADTHSAEASTELGAYDCSENDRTAIAEVGSQLLIACRPVPGACVMMNALYLAGLQKRTAAPTYMVMGKLLVRGAEVFGPAEVPTTALFAQTNLSWPGHAWIVSGSYMADASIFRTAYSDSSPPLLRNYVVETFGAGGGLLMQEWRPLDPDFVYVPQYVPTQGEVERLYRGAADLLLA